MVNAQDVAWKIAGTDNTKSSEELTTLCWNELAEIEARIPDTMRIGDRETVLRNNEQQITLVKDDVEMYHFLYTVYTPTGEKASTLTSSPFVLLF